jgi:hypothetical protein
MTDQSHIVSFFKPDIGFKVALQPTWIRCGADAFLAQARY